MPGWVVFLIGLLAGGFLGMFAVCLCVVSGSGEHSGADDLRKRE